MTTRKFSFALLSIIVGIVACTNQSNSDASLESIAAKQQSLFVTNCGSCHNDQSIIAPPPFGIQKHYKDEYADEASFVKAITEFVQHPSSERALLKPAVEKWGVMPTLSFSDEDLNTIATYLYNGEFNHPSGEHHKQMHGQMHGNESVDADSTSIGKGKKIAMATQMLLGSNLKAQMQENGPIAALDFCNLNAIKLTNEKAKEFETFIQRVSNKPRNQDNTASEFETALIKEYELQLAEGETLKPTEVEEEDTKWFYAPIITNQICIKCHGEPSGDLKNEITKRYPEDKATGYSENQIRGLWKIKV